MAIDLETQEVQDFMESRKQILADKFGARTQAAMAMSKLLMMAQSKTSMMKRVVGFDPEFAAQVPKQIATDAAVLSEMSGLLGIAFEDVVWLTKFTRTLLADLNVVATVGEPENV